MNDTGAVVFDAIYFDGRMTNPQPATVVLRDGQWHVSAIATGAELACHPLDPAAISDRLASRLPRLITFPDGASLEVHDCDALNAFTATLSRQRLGTFVHALETHATFAAIATVLVVLSVAALFKFGLPKLAESVAANLPESIEQTLGQTTLAAFNQFGGPSQLSFEQRMRVDLALERILLPEETTPRLHYRKLGELPNAFALPGHTIVITDSILDHLSDDELAAVLAHELGHLEVRHAEQNLLLSSTSLLLIAAATGDLTTLASFAGTLPLTLIQSGYSRDFERAADAMACARLSAVGIAPSNLADALRRLEESLPTEKRQFSYLSTHPSNEERYDSILHWVPTAAD